MKPFDDYPEGGYTILRTRTGDLARQGYGHWLVERCQTICAYCEISLVESYPHWLLLVVDHVIPEKEAQRLGICRRWYDSYSNLVLACSGCNGFCNQYKVSWQEPRESWRESEFFELRDKVFKRRAAQIRESREREMRFYNDRVAPIATALKSNAGIT